MATSETRWTQATLQDAWSQMFDYSFYQSHFEDLDVQCILMLLEGGLSHVKKLGTAYSALKASEKQLVLQLEQKTNECWSLRGKIDKLSKNCTKCQTLETSLIDARKRAKEAQARMDSIANILRLGQLEPSQSGQRNAAMDLVSQMILHSSPPLKKLKRSNSKEPVSPDKMEILAPDSTDVLSEKNNQRNVIIPATFQLSPKKRTPPESPNISRVRSLVRSPIIDVNFIPTSRSRETLSRSFDPPQTSSKVSAVKKNLSTDIDQKKPGGDNALSPAKPIFFDLKKGPPPLDDTLKEYVNQESTGKLLDNILFSDEEDGNSKKENQAMTVQESHKESSPGLLIAETPCPKQKKADFWLLKEKRGPGEVSKANGRKMRQMKLELGFKKAQKKVDLAQLPAAPKGSVVQDGVEDDDIIIAASPGTQHTRPDREKYPSQECDVNTTDFLPLAASTQKPKAKLSLAGTSKSSKAPLNEFDRLPTKDTNKEPDFVYARGAVKKKADRDKLEGWECKECAEYYSTLGKNLNPAELKIRMNACSRHRNKFKPRINDTPPAFWNPLFPTSQECKGYVSVSEDSDS